jgi:hypothetical protein
LAKLLIVNEGSDKVPPKNFPSTPTTITSSLPSAVFFIHVKSVISKKLDTQHVMVWLCPPTTSAIFYISAYGGGVFVRLFFER